MKNFIRLITSLLATLTIVSCETIFEYPEDGTGIDPTLVNISLSLKLDLTSTIDFGEYDEFTTLSKGGEATQYYLRTIVEIYDSNDPTTVIERTIKYYDYLNLDEFVFTETYPLNAKEYQALVWADVVDNCNNVDLYYSSNNLKNILPTEPYNGATDLKHCFSDVIDIDLTPYRDEWNIVYEAEGTLERPLARFEIITTDFDKFIEDEVRSRAEDGDTKVDIDPSKYSVTLHYDGYMPYGYSVETDLPNRAETGVEYTTSLEQLSDSEARLTFDHLFVNHVESSVQVSLMIYNEEGELAKQTNSINIPLLRNHKTIIKDAYLTSEYVPGLTIDPSFEGDINIWVD